MFNGSSLLSISWETEAEGRSFLEFRCHYEVAKTPAETPGSHCATVCQEIVTVHIASSKNHQVHFHYYLSVVLQVFFSVLGLADTANDAVNADQLRDIN